MSHTTTVKAPGWKHAVLIHNGDWSGPTELRAWRKTSVNKEAELVVVIDENRSCRVTTYGASVDIGGLADLFVCAGRAMGVSQLSDAVTRATESFE